MSDVIKEDNRRRIRELKNLIITNSMAYGTWRFNAAFTKALQFRRFWIPLFLKCEVVSLTPNPLSWRTTPGRLSTTAYSIYSQLTSIIIFVFCRKYFNYNLHSCWTESLNLCRMCVISFKSEKYSLFQILWLVLNKKANKVFFLI